MPGPSDISRGNIALSMVLGVTLSPALVALGTTVQQTFTVNGLQLGDQVTVGKPTTQAGLAVTGARVTAANTLGIEFANVTAGNITPTAGEIYTVEVNRVSNPQLPLPTALV